jgi:hypothetical protein
MKKGDIVRAINPGHRRFQSCGLIIIEEERFYLHCRWSGTGRNKSWAKKADVEPHVNTPDVDAMHTTRASLSTINSEPHAQTRNLHQHRR